MRTHLGGARGRSSPSSSSSFFFFFLLLLFFLFFLFFLSVTGAEVCTANSQLASRGGTDLPRHLKEGHHGTTRWANLYPHRPRRQAQCVNTPGRGTRQEFSNIRRDAPEKYRVHPCGGDNSPSSHILAKMQRLTPKHPCGGQLVASPANQRGRAVLGPAPRGSIQYSPLVLLPRSVQKKKGTGWQPWIPMRT